MKKNTLTVDVRKPVDVVFDFTVNPANTHKWIPSVLEERSSDPDTKIGAEYRQKLAGGGSSAIVVTGFIKNKKLEFRLVDGTYTCLYIYHKIPGGTRLTYHEDSGNDGELESPMTMENMLKLKKLVEML